MSKTEVTESSATYCPTCGGWLRIGVDPRESPTPAQLTLGLQQFTRMGETVASDGRKVFLYGLAVPEGRQVKPYGKRRAAKFIRDAAGRIDGFEED